MPMIEVVFDTEEEECDESILCSTEDCNTPVSPDGRYFATYCGTFCDECGVEHVKECSTCADDL